MWKLKEAFPLIDLGLDYFTVKLSVIESQQQILQDDPWFVVGAYVSARVWEPNFILKQSTIESTAIWIRLRQLPTEYYDGSILERVGRKVGKLHKVDSCTSSTLRGKFLDLPFLRTNLIPTDNASTSGAKGKSVKIVTYYPNGPSQSFGPIG
ncbi:hypothetical protein BC332_01942 [Capsicum chinense]|nr:hypothetical protein BC332_01942 [Capsicum chinense]